MPIIYGKDDGDSPNAVPEWQDCFQKNEHIHIFDKELSFYVKAYIENGCQTTTRRKRFNHYLMHKLVKKKMELYWHDRYMYEEGTYIVDNVAFCLEIHL